MFDIPKLRGILEDRGIRHAEFARMANVPVTTFSNAISGRGRPVSRVVVSRVANTLGLPREEILASSDEDEQEPAA